MTWEKLVDKDLEGLKEDHPHHKTILSKIHGFLTFLIFRRMDFKFHWTMYYVCTGMTFGAIISAMDDISYMDGVFIAASSMTGSGLSTVPMSRLSSGTFMILGILMMIGCAPFMLIPVTLYRRHCIGEAMNKVDSLRKQKLLPKERNLTRLEQNICKDYRQIDDALGVLGMIIVMYYIGFIVMGTFLIYLALHLQPLHEELKHRGFTYFDDATFLAVSAFANAGITITTDNLIGMSHNPCAYIVLTWLIIAGNTALPIFLRTVVASITYIESRFFAKWIPSTEELVIEDPRGQRPSKRIIIESSRGKYRRTLQFILNHPRRLTTHMFSHLQTKVLAGMVISLILVQYVFFLGSTMNRNDALFNHSPAVLAGIGYFQTLSTRSAGFAMMDLRELNQGLLFIYAIMMYMSAFPFVSTLQKYSKEKPKLVDEKVGGDDSEDDEENMRKVKRSTQMTATMETGVSTSMKSSSSTKANPYTSAKINIIRDIEMATPPMGSTKGGVSYGVSSKNTADDDRILVAHDHFDELPLTKMRVMAHNTLRDEEDPKQVEEDNSTLGADIEDEEVSSATSSSGSYVAEDKMKASHINKRFLKHYFFRHSFFLALAVLVCAFSEDHMLKDPAYNVNLWYIMFEIISAYGNVGLSLGIPGQVISLSGAFSPLGKCVIIFIMWLGKHRGLPSRDDEVIDFQCEDYLAACRYYEYSQLKRNGNGDQENVLFNSPKAAQSSEATMSKYVSTALATVGIDPNSGSTIDDEKVVTYHPFHVSH